MIIVSQLFQDDIVIPMKEKIILLILTCVLTVSLSSCKKVVDKDDTSSRTVSKGTSSALVNSKIESLISQAESVISAVISDVIPEVSAPAVLNPNYTDIAKLSNKKNGWGQGTQVDKDNRPISCDTFQSKYGQYNAVFIKENNKNVYLTFDEGYENGYTSKILDVLKEKKAPAVFFVTYDYAKRNPDLIKRMIAEGHIVGNHSYTHPSMPTVSLEKASEEITKLHDYIKENFNYTMTLFRPPMGEYSEQTLALTKELGYQSVFWSFAYKDWDTKNQPDETTALKKTVDAVHGGAVYLLHAVSQTNTNILGGFIDGVRTKGFEFQALK